MKKAFAIFLAVSTVLSLAACGGKKPSEESNNNVASSTQQEQGAPAPGSNSQEINPVESIFHPGTSSATGAYATIKVSAEIKMDDESGWLGLCPAGKDYITESEADDVDVIWFNYEAREEGDPYVYACDFESVEDGTYALVVTSSDDESVGYVIIQLEMTKKGDELTFDFENAKLKERP